MGALVAFGSCGRAAGECELACGARELTSRNLLLRYRRAGCAAGGAILSHASWEYNGVHWGQYMGDGWGRGRARPSLGLEEEEEEEEEEKEKEEKEDKQ